MKFKVWGLSVLCIAALAVSDCLAGQRLVRPSEPCEDGTAYVVGSRTRGAWYRKPFSGLPILPRRAPGYAPIQIQYDENADDCRRVTAEEVRETVETAVVSENTEVQIPASPEENSEVTVQNGEENKENQEMSVTSAPFGETKEGEKITAWTLKNANGLTAVILDFGGVLYEMKTPDRDGNFANISCNYPTIPEYQEIRPYFGSLVGRYGNRIAKGKFTIDGVDYQVPVNNDENALHGGLKGFDQRIWNVEPFSNPNEVGLKLTYTAADGEEGYPGKLDVTVVYSLNNNNELMIDYTAATDKATPINLTNHTFWNLSGATSGTIRGTELTLGADRFLPTDGGLIPTGEVASVEGTPLDFRTAKTIGQDIDKITEPQFNGGYDHCLVLAKEKEGELSFCALAFDPASGRTMEVTTTEPAVQFYSGNFLDGSTGVGDYKYEKQSAFCLETQHYPDSPNHPEFPNTILRPGDVYRHTTIHKFGVK